MYTGSRNLILFIANRVYVWVLSKIMWSIVEKLGEIMKFKNPLENEERDEYLSVLIDIYRKY